MKIPFSCCSFAWISLIEIVSRLSNGFGLYNKWQEGTHFGPFLWKEKFQIAGDCSLDFQDCFGKFVSKSFQLKLFQLKILCNVYVTNDQKIIVARPTNSRQSQSVFIRIFFFQISRVGLFINRTFSTFVAKIFFKFCIQNKNCFVVKQIFAGHVLESERFSRLSGKIQRVSWKYLRVESENSKISGEFAEA